MATDNASQMTEVEVLYQDLGERIAKGEREAPAADLLADFEEYYRQLQDLRGKLHEAEESLARGEGGPLDVDALLKRAEQRRDEKGIPK